MNTLGGARHAGLREISAYCPDCRTSYIIGLDARILDLPDETPMAVLPKMRDFACPSCGKSAVSLCEENSLDEILRISDTPFNRGFVARLVNIPAHWCPYPSAGWPYKSWIAGWGAAKSEQRFGQVIN